MTFEALIFPAVLTLDQRQKQLLRFPGVCVLIGGNPERADWIILAGVLKTCAGNLTESGSSNITNIATGTISGTGAVTATTGGIQTIPAARCISSKSPCKFEIAGRDGLASDCVLSHAVGLCGARTVPI